MNATSPFYWPNTIRSQQKDNQKSTPEVSPVLVTRPNWVQLRSSRQSKANAKMILWKGALLPAGKRVTRWGSVPEQCIPEQRIGSSSLREMMHNHQGELRHDMYRWRHPCTCAVSKHAYTYTTCSKMMENLHPGKRFYYNEDIMRKVQEEGSRGSSRLLWRDPWLCKSSPWSPWKE